MISIVIPVFNNHDMTHDCINAVRECTQGNYEIVVIDNGSTPPFQPPFTGFNETTLIRNEENKGFPVAVNQGIRAAKGDTIILLNNDVIVTPGALDRLVSWMEEYSIVGPMTNFAAGLQQVQIGSYQSREELDKEAAFLAEENAGQAEEVNFVIGFCMAFKKLLFDEIGVFDESLWPCSGEEIDFCFKAKAAGHRIGIAHDVYVHHEGSRTFSDMEKAGQINYAEIVNRNDKHLKEKWGVDFWSNQAVDPDEPTGDKIENSIGAHTYGAENIKAFFPEEGALVIGKYCSIGPEVKIYLGGEHRADWITTYPFSHFHPEIKGYDYRISKGNVIIGNDVWIGHGVIILSGVTIGDGAIIGAGAVVASDVKPYSIVVGNPTKHMRFRFSDDQIQALLSLQWWNWPEEIVKEAIPLLQSGDILGFIGYAKQKGF